MQTFNDSMSELAKKVFHSAIASTLSQRQSIRESEGALNEYQRQREECYNTIERIFSLIKKDKPSKSHLQNEITKIIEAKHHRIKNFEYLIQKLESTIKLLDRLKQDKKDMEELLTKKGALEETMRIIETEYRKLAMENPFVKSGLAMMKQASFRNQIKKEKVAEEERNV